MAHYHCSIKSGKKGRGADHAQYIERGGRFAAEEYGEIGESERGNLPEWAQGSAARFFAVADERERANGSAYREFQLALPRELDEAQRGALVREFVAQEIGDRHAYVWAIHEPTGANPHVHIMFSERTRDEIERGPEQYFKRANRKQPERGGCLKSDRFSGGLTRLEREAAVEDLRARWEVVQNRVLERAGSLERVDHRSLRDQGIEREPGQHRGPAISGIEARGQIAQVSVRREAQRYERREALEPERAGIVADIRAVSREEVAVQRVAARERRELAQEVRSGPVREEVLKRVEADRREQLERLSAQAEQRVERRQGLSIGRQLKGKLLTQARSLRERIGQQLGRVREWVLERFPASRQRPKRAKTRKPLSVEEQQRQGREEWQAMRAEVAKQEAEYARAMQLELAPVLSVDRPGRGLKVESIRLWNETMAAKPIERQVEVLESLRQQLQRERCERLGSVLKKAMERGQRRQTQLRAFAKQEPPAPKGLLGTLRRRAYEETHQIWRARYQDLEKLSQASQRQQQRLFEANQFSPLQAYADDLLQQHAPELVERVRTEQLRRREKVLQQDRSLSKESQQQKDIIKPRHDRSRGL